MKKGARGAPDSCQPRRCVSPIIAVMMPAAMMVPPVPADPARTVIGVDDPAARIVAVVGRVVAAMEEAAVMMEMRDAIAAVMAKSAVAHAAAVPASAATEGMHASAVKAAAMESATVETAVTATMAAATVTAAAMTAADLNQAIARSFRR